MIILNIDYREDPYEFLEFTIETYREKREINVEYI